ncbi:hypothetical protein B0H14DRAFT_3493066 [Mycena olivaceomarginata]|nr:hypothetical protein B0H14DRAFT_3493066 [Mycena olivaceomarginata]
MSFIPKDACAKRHYPAIRGSELMCDFPPAMLGTWTQYRVLDAHELTNAEEMQIYLCGVKSLHTVQRPRCKQGAGRMARLKVQGSDWTSAAGWEGFEFAALSSVWVGGPMVN